MGSTSGQADSRSKTKAMGQSHAERSSQGAEQEWAEMIHTQGQIEEGQPGTNTGLLQTSLLLSYKNKAQGESWGRGLEWQGGSQVTSQAPTEYSCFRDQVLGAMFGVIVILESQAPSMHLPPGGYKAMSVVT